MMRKAFVVIAALGALAVAACNTFSVVDWDKDTSAIPTSDSPN